HAASALRPGAAAGRSAAATARPAAAARPLTVAVPAGAAAIAVLLAGRRLLLPLPAAGAMSGAGIALSRRHTGAASAGRLLRGVRLTQPVLAQQLEQVHAIDLRGARRRADVAARGLEQPLQVGLLEGLDHLLLGLFERRNRGGVGGGLGRQL